MGCLWCVVEGHGDVGIGIFGVSGSGIGSLAMRLRSGKFRYRTSGRSRGNCATLCLEGGHSRGGK